MQEHNREIMVYSCGGRCWSPAFSDITRTQDYSPEIALSSLRGAVSNVSAYAFTTTLNHFATVVMFHNITSVTYGLPVSKMLTTSSGVTTDESTATGVHRVRAVSDLHPKCSHLLYWSNRHGDQPHSCMPGYTFRLPADAKE